ncbi:MAG TPA: hypothetical protein VK625_23590 [Flavitalea sp.]|nr:hypothetical protein [Flavitalea sp.]
MLSDDVRQKLQHIVRGTVIETAQDHCTTIRNFLCSGYSTSTAVKTNFESQPIIKEEQAERLKEYATVNDLWLESLPENSQYLTRGGESKVYLDNDNRHVIKINDAIYYATWLEYFNSLVLHNLIFLGTAYDFFGFVSIDGNLHAVVKQLYITSDAPVNLTDMPRK